MKKEMSKIIVERERSHNIGLKNPKGYKKRLKSLENAPKRESMRKRWKASAWHKELTECLGPLYRWLNSKVGQLWDKVHSELCENLKRESAIQDHVRDHAEWYVEKNVIMVKGVPHDSSFFPLLWSRGRQLYVHPKTGILCQIPRRKVEKKKEENFIIIGSLQQIHKISGIWYLLDLVKLEKKDLVRPYKFRIGNKNFTSEIFICFRDLAYGDNIKQEYQLMDRYGGHYKPVSKKQLSTEEIKKYVGKG